MMSLRYKGKPDPGKNRVADEVLKICTCEFVSVGSPMFNNGCKVHTKTAYPCGYRTCQCSDYRPKYVKKNPGHWPMCMCGHAAQDH